MAPRRATDVTLVSKNLPVTRLSTVSSASGLGSRLHVLPVSLFQQIKLWNSKNKVKKSKTIFMLFSSQPPARSLRLQRTDLSSWLAQIPDGFTPPPKSGLDTTISWSTNASLDTESRGKSTPYASMENGDHRRRLCVSACYTRSCPWTGSCTDLEVGRGRPEDRDMWLRRESSKAHLNNRFHEKFSWKFLTKKSRDFVSRFPLSAA